MSYNPDLLDWLYAWRGLMSGELAAAGLRVSERREIEVDPNFPSLARRLDVVISSTSDDDISDLLQIWPSADGDGLFDLHLLGRSPTYYLNDGSFAEYVIFAQDGAEGVSPDQLAGSVVHLWRAVDAKR